MDLTSAVAVNVNVIFFQTNNVLQGQVCIIARVGHPCTQNSWLFQVLREIVHFPRISSFFFACIGLQIGMGHTKNKEEIFLNSLCSCETRVKKFSV